MRVGLHGTTSHDRDPRSSIIHIVDERRSLLCEMGGEVVGKLSANGL